MKQNDPPIITATCVYNQKISNVWSAITELNKMKEWYFAMLPDFKAEVGFKTNFIVENEGRVFDHHWKVTEVVSKKKIVYEWRFTGFVGSGYTVWELTDLGEQTRLTLTNVVTEDYPDDIPEFKTESCQAGWDYFIKEALASYLS